jgi:hypothetical protein
MNDWRFWALVALLVGGAVWLVGFAPCEFYSFVAVKDVPLRCFQAPPR